MRNSRTAGISAVLPPFSVATFAMPTRMDNAGSSWSEAAPSPTKKYANHLAAKKPAEARRVVFEAEMSTTAQALSPRRLKPRQPEQAKKGDWEKWSDATGAIFLRNEWKHTGPDPLKVENPSGIGVFDPSMNDAATKGITVRLRQTCVYYCSV